MNDSEAESLRRQIEELKIGLETIRSDAVQSAETALGREIEASRGPYIIDLISDKAVEKAKAQVLSKSHFFLAGLLALSIIALLLRTALISHLSLSAMDIALNDQLTREQIANGLVSNPDLITAMSKRVGNDYVLPIGSISAFAGRITTATVNNVLWPRGWLPCDGRSLRCSDAPTGCQVLKDLWGEIETDGIRVSQVALPDLRGYFLRGLDSKQGVDPADDRTVGSIQMSAVADHRHHYTLNSDRVALGHNHSRFEPGGVDGAITHYSSAIGLQEKTAWVSNVYGDDPNVSATPWKNPFQPVVDKRESRPVNRAVHDIIRVR